MLPTLPWLHFIVTRVCMRLACARGREDGQGLVEYALILALIVVVAVAALKLFGAKVTAVLSSDANSV
jgi:Flp pilus assembly pilin Flp